MSAFSLFWFCFILYDNIPFVNNRRSTIVLFWSLNNVKRGGEDESKHRLLSSPPPRSMLLEIYLVFRQPDEYNRQFEQAGHCYTEDDRAVDVRARGQEGRGDPHSAMPRRSLASQRLRGDHTQCCHEGQHKRYFKDNAEGQQEEGYKGEVTIRRNQFGEVCRRKVDQPVHRV